MQKPTPNPARDRPVGEQRARPGEPIGDRTAPLGRSPGGRHGDQGQDRAQEVEAGEEVEGRADPEQAGRGGRDQAANQVGGDIAGDVGGEGAGLGPGRTNLAQVRQGQGECHRHAETLQHPQRGEGREIRGAGQERRGNGEGQEAGHDADPAVKRLSEERGQQGADGHAEGGGIDGHADHGRRRRVAMGEQREDGLGREQVHQGKEGDQGDGDAVQRRMRQAKCACTDGCRHRSDLSLKKGLRRESEGGGTDARATPPISLTSCAGRL